MGTKKLSVMDAMFLAAETRESMMHVGGMLTFTLPPDAPPTFLRQVADELRGDVPVHAPWNLRLRFPDLLRNPVQSWVEDEVDLDYHVRRSALPSPGDERELGILVSRLHSRPSRSRVTRCSGTSTRQRRRGRLVIAARCSARER